MTDATAPTRSRRASGLLFLGVLVVALFFGGLGAWAWYAPLDSAALAPGVVVADTKRRSIEHLEGGIIAELNVRDGDHVEAGDVLIRLDGARARSELEVLRGRYWGLIALRARLAAEQAGDPSVAFPSDLIDRMTGNPEIAQIVIGQRNLFESRRQNIESQIAVLNSRIEQSKRQIAGLQSQKTSLREQDALIDEERADAEKMFKKGLERRQRVLALQREAAALRGERGRLDAEIERVRQQIGEAELRAIALKNDLQNEVVGELRQVEDEIFSLRERIIAAEDVVSRLEVRSPVAGVVVNMAVNTLGGVITPGQPVMELVPDLDTLVVEAQLSPIDIDSIHVGLPAQVMLTAYSQRIVPSVDGVVRRVSADALVDQQTGLSYYLARVEVTEDELAKYPEVRLYPGMPADVIIPTAQRTGLDYLIGPIVQSFNRAFREQ